MSGRAFILAAIAVLSAGLSGLSGSSAVAARVEQPAAQGSEFLASQFQSMRPPRGPPAPKDFVDILDTFDAAMSPDGGSVVSIHTQWLSAATRLNDRILIASVDTPASPRVTISREELFARWVLWPKDRYIVAAKFGFVFSRRRIDVFDQLVAIDPANGAERIIYSAPLRRNYSQYRPPRIVWSGPRDGSTILIVSYLQRRGDLTEIDLASGRQRLVERGTELTVHWVVDESGRALVRIDRDPASGVLLYFGRAEGGAGWRLLETVPAEIENDFSVVARSERPNEVIVTGQPDTAQTRGVYRYNLATGELGELLFSHDRYDVADAFVDHRDGSYLGAWYYDDVLQYQFVEPDTQHDADALRAELGPQRSWIIVDSDDDRSHWLIYSSAPQDPGTWWAFDRDQDKLTRLFDAQTDLLPEDLSPVEPWRWTASDGQEVPGYLTRPRTPSSGPRPLVVMPHGGPELRDILAFDPWAQFFASRGYLVFQPNFRGSDGFGRSFRDAGRRQWGLRSQQDIEDGVSALIASGQADPNRLVIVGASYGGYVSLMAATDPQTRYRCAVAIAAVTDLPALVAHEQRRSEQTRRPQVFDYVRQVIGDPIADAQQLRATSPINRVSNLRIPLLIMHPDEDQRVPFAQFQTFIAAARAAGRTIQSTVIEDEGHNGWHTDTEVRVMSDINWFLTRCMMD